MIPINSINPSSDSHISHTSHQSQFRQYSPSSHPINPIHLINPSSDNFPIHPTNPSSDNVLHHSPSHKSQISHKSRFRPTQILFSKSPLLLQQDLYEFFVPVIRCGKINRLKLFLLHKQADLYLPGYY